MITGFQFQQIKDFLTEKKLLNKENLKDIYPINDFPIYKQLFLSIDRQSISSQLIDPANYLIDQKKPLQVLIYQRIYNLLHLPEFQTLLARLNLKGNIINNELILTNQ